MWLEQHAVNQYIGKCINRINLRNLQNDLTKVYIDNGYTTTRIYFDLHSSKVDLQNLVANVFVLVIEEGRIGDINLLEILPPQKPVKSNKLSVKS